MGCMQPHTSDDWVSPGYPPPIMLLDTDIMDSHENYFLILKALTFISVVSPCLLGPPFQLVKTACR